jgi:hypothetical protein
MARIRRFFLENWQAKLMALVVASAVWYLIKKNVEATPDRWRPDRRPALAPPPPPTS